MDTNRLILDNTLKFLIKVVTYKTDENRAEINKNYTMTKKQFMKALEGKKIVVKLVEKYPEEIKPNVIYVGKSGKTVWIKETED